MLEAHELHTYYGQSYVLQGVSVTIPDDRLAVVMGRNGVGKTTLVRSICGVTPPKSGRVVLDGVELQSMRPHRAARRGLATVPQGRHIFPTVTVGEHLTKVIPKRSRGEERWTTERIFEVFPKLRERWNQRAGTLSGGEQSMLAMARALRLQPSCLLMDEPMEGLSPAFVDVVCEVIQRLREDGGMSMLLVVPELDIALDLADEIYVLSTGSVVFRGTPDELRANPEVQSRYIGIEE